MTSVGLGETVVDLCGLEGKEVPKPGQQVPGGYQLGRIRLGDGSGEATVRLEPPLPELLTPPPKARRS